MDYRNQIYPNIHYKDNSNHYHERLEWLHEQLTHAIDREFDLLGQRLTILITGNAFLFPSTAIALGATTKESTFLHLNYLVPAAVLLFFLFGITICSMSIVTMNAARLVIKKKKKKRKIVEEYLIEEMKNIGFSYLTDVVVHFEEKNHNRGNLTYRYLPGFIILIWCLLILVIVVFHTRYYPITGDYIQNMISFIGI